MGRSCVAGIIGRELAWLPGPKQPGARLLGPRLLGARLLGPKLLGARLMTNPGLLMVLGLLLGLRLVLQGPRLPGLGIRLG